MNNDFRFMNEVFRIITGALRLDTDKVRNYTAFLADKLEKAGDVTSANHLRKLLQENDHQLRPTSGTFARALPVDSESRFPLLERVESKKGQEEPLVLAPDQWEITNEFISVAKSHAQVDALGLGNSLALLLYGPPGTGKSRLARYVAAELGLELYIARLDGLISSFLGSTSKNIRALFDFASKNPCVLFLDEFDAIAKLRSDGQEVGELKRVVNSFIQNLDTLGTQSIVLAATNHPELLDGAIWRRFSYRIKLELPTASMREELWREFLLPLEFTAREIHLLGDLTEGFSGSDIQEVCVRLRRRFIISKERPQFHELFALLRNNANGEDAGRRFLSKIQQKDEPTIVKVLRERNAKLYSHAAVAELLGVSKATSQRWSQDVENGK